jgi:transcriptional regulator with XRE-family HTH domain
MTKRSDAARAACEDYEKAMGAQIRRLRMERNWSQEYLGKRMEMLGFALDQTTISNLELARRPIRVAEVAALSLIFCLPPFALWHLPVAGAPVSQERARENLQAADEKVEEMEKALHLIAGSYADALISRARAAQEIHAAAQSR